MNYVLFFRFQLKPIYLIQSNLCVCVCMFSDIFVDFLFIFLWFINLLFRDALSACSSCMLINKQDMTNICIATQVQLTDPLGIDTDKFDD
jgi:hypothetical protein